jgi:hypothetical protein
VNGQPAEANSWQTVSGLRQRVIALTTETAVINVEEPERAGKRLEGHNPCIAEHKSVWADEPRGRMLGDAVGDLDLADNSPSEKILFPRQASTLHDRLVQPVLGCPARLLKRDVVLLSDRGSGVDQDAPAEAGRPVPVFDIHPSMEDRPRKRLSDRKSNFHANDDLIRADTLLRVEQRAL